MNDEVYIKHQYDALTKNATPLGILCLAAQLKDFVKTKLARVYVRIYAEQNKLIGTVLFHAHVEEGKPIVAILESVLSKAHFDGKPNAVIKDLTIYAANTEAVIDAGPWNIDRWRVDPDQDVWRPVSWIQPAEAGKHYEITVTI